MVLVADLLNVFEVFLPQLLLYPNPSDPLNGDAASLMMKDRKLYDQKVKGKTILYIVYLFESLSSNCRKPFLIKRLCCKLLNFFDKSGRGPSIQCNVERELLINF